MEKLILRHLVIGEVAPVYSIAVVALAVEHGWFPKVRGPIFEPGPFTIPDWNEAVDYLIGVGVGELAKKPPSQDPAQT